MKHLSFKLCGSQLSILIGQRCTTYLYCTEESMWIIILEPFLVKEYEIQQSSRKISLLKAVGQADMQKAQGWSWCIQYVLQGCYINTTALKLLFVFLQRALDTQKLMKQGALYIFSCSFKILLIRKYPEFACAINLCAGVSKAIQRTDSSRSICTTVESYCFLQHHHLVYNAAS